MDDLRQTVIDAYRRHFDTEPTVVVRAPGRVNLLGAHVDYSEGWVLPAAIDRAVWLAAGPDDDGRLDVVSLDFDERRTLDLGALPPPVPERSADGSGAHWSDLPGGMAWALDEAGHRPPGLRGVFTSDVPMGAGVSSSAAVEMAFVLAFERLSDGAWGLDGAGLPGADLARLGQRVENGYLGLGSGIMDQFASIHGRRDHAFILDCRDLSFRQLPLPADAAVLVADSGVRRRLSASGFNDRRGQCEEAVTVLRAHLPGIRTLRDVSETQLELHAHRLPLELRRRSQHAVAECRRVRDGADALDRGDLGAFGQLMRQSHASSRDLYEVSIPELDTLAAAAWSSDGCWGARMSGGGFGGCVTALVHRDALDTVRGTMIDAFDVEYGRRPTLFDCAVSDGASVHSP